MKMKSVCVYPERPGHVPPLRAAPRPGAPAGLGGTPGRRASSSGGAKRPHSPAEPNPPALPSPSFLQGDVVLHCPQPGAPSPQWGRPDPPNPGSAGKPRARRGRGRDARFCRGGQGHPPPPHPARGLPDPAAAAVRGEHGWAPGPQQLENSLRETIKVDYPVESWSGNYLVN